MSTTRLVGDMRGRIASVSSTAGQASGLVAVILSLLSFAVGIWLAWNYPLFPSLTLGVFIAVASVAAANPLAWLVTLPALLPVIGLAPWTGWVTFEEFDMLVLAAAAGAYGRIAWARRGGHAAAKTDGSSKSIRLMATLFMVSTIVAMIRGFNDAGGFNFGWFQGYLEPMNSARLGKSIVLALLLWPLWRDAQVTQPVQATRTLSLGMLLGLAIASLATVWERLAYTGLLNFSSDYRTTAMFWEMHMGGAALDGFLALTMPFAANELMQARTRARWVAAVCVTVLAAYACLTTFSRGVYLAVPLGLTIFLGLSALQRRDLSDSGTAQPDTLNSVRSGLAGLMLVALFGAGLAWMFQSSGYRGAGALLGLVALLLPLTKVLRAMSARDWVLGGIAGLLLAAMLAAMAMFIPKGAYLAYIVGFGITGFMIWTPRQNHNTSNSIASTMAFAGLVSTAAATVLVANHWGETPAIAAAIVAAIGCLLLAMVAGLASRPLWPEVPRWQSGIVFILGIAIFVIGVFSGGAYMENRFTSGSRDLAGRLAHWKTGTGMLNTPADWWLGKGLGRFPANYVLVGDLGSHPGGYQLMQEGVNEFVRLTGGLHMLGSGEVFRITQRVAEPSGPVSVSALVRTPMNVSLLFEVCEKHLLYSTNCLNREIAVNAAPGSWQTVTAQLQGTRVSRGDWYAPRLLAFSVAISTRGGTAELDQLQLTGSDGRDLLGNGDFSNGMAHWFSSSDKWHLPWHMKNMFLHVLFDQGIVGLGLWSLLLGGALIRLTVGRVKFHPLAPVITASLAGFMIVGLFDSLLDVPRLAWLFYLLIVISLTLHAPSKPAAR